MEKKTYRICYEVHCKLKNFFGKEILVKNCQSGLHAKIKLNTFCQKTYGYDFDYIIIKTISEENPINYMGEDFNAIFKDIFKKN